MKRLLIVFCAFLVFGCESDTNSSDGQKKNSDIKITNTAQVNDISQSVAIREEAKKQFLDSIARSYSDPTVIHTTKVDYKKTAAYTSNFNRHYIAIDFDTNIVREGDVFATVYMEVDEIDG